MRKFKRLTMTLVALLITAVSGAWADGTVYNTTVALKDLKAGDVLTDGFKLTTEIGQYIYVKGYKKDGGTAETGDYTQLNAYNSTFPGGVTISESGSTYTPYADGKDANAWIVNDWKDLGSATMLYLDGYNYTPTEWSLTPDQTGKTWTLAKMPANNVELQVEYYAESHLFLSKEALADTANIVVKNGETDVEFGNDGKSTTTVTEGNTVTAKFTGKKVLGMTVAKKAPKPDFLAGVFSVSGSKKVNFSKSNLRYASSKWSFFDNQYDYYNSYSADAWDKFGWSTSATTYGMNTSESNGTYSGDFVDWGATMGTGWFTLTSAEWEYLFNTRSASNVGGTDNGRYAKAKVNNVPGVILFPDTYTHPDGVTDPTDVNATDNPGWNGNNYSSADWTKMESAGCVFLPAAGYRTGSTVNYLGMYGYYWSATPDDTNSAYYVNFGSSVLNPAYSYYRNLGFSVRLVRQVTE